MELSFYLITFQKAYFDIFKDICRIWKGSKALEDCRIGGQAKRKIKAVRYCTAVAVHSTEILGIYKANVYSIKPTL